MPNYLMNSFQYIKHYYGTSFLVGLWVGIISSSAEIVINKLFSLDSNIVIFIIICSLGLLAYGYFELKKNRSNQVIQ